MNERILLYLYMILFDTINSMRETWTRSLAEICPFDYIFPAFLDHISPIGITSEQVRGNVLVIGQAGAFPEKTLVCTTESNYRELRPEVDTVYCCDTFYPSSPEFHLDVPCVNTISYRKIPKPEPNTAYYELSSCYTFLQRTPLDFFDTALMFRSVDTGAQIEELGLVKTIAPHLKRGRHFICSGGRFPTTPSENFYHPLNLVTSVGLANFSDGYPFRQNMGVILQK